VETQPSKHLMPVRRANLPVTMFQLTSVNSVASPLLPVFGRRLRRFLALRCPPCGLVALHSPTSRPQVPRDSLAWSPYRLMEALSRQAPISPTYRLSTPVRRPLIPLHRALLELQAILRALSRTQLGSPPPHFLLHLIMLLANALKTI